jgi:hypothetical protein
MAAPVALYFWFITDYGVNVPFADSWNGTLPLVLDFARGHLTLAELWQPHNENRMLVPNVILVLLDSDTRMNQVVDMLVSASMLVGAVAITVWLAARTLKLPLIWLIPIPAIMLALVQTQDALWAFQLAWTLIILLTVVALAMLELAGTKWSLFVVACCAAVLASFSSLQGLMVWPIGALYGAALGWQRRRAVIWIALGCVTAVVYTFHFGPVYPPANLGAIISQPILSFRFFLILIGSPFVYHPFAMGVLVLGLVGGSMLLAFRGRPWARYRLPLALIGTVLLFDVLVTQGRVSLGLSQANASRYTTYNLVLVASAYLLAVAAARPPRRMPRFGWPSGASAYRFGLLSVAVILAAWQFGAGLPYGLQQGQVFSASLSQGASLLRNYRNVSAPALGLHLFSGEGDYIEQWAPILKKYHWAPFP